MKEENNKIKTEPAAENTAAPAPPKNKRRFSILFLLNGEFLQKDYFLKNIPFFLFIAFILAIYIANAYYAENKIREITSAENDIKELHAEYISIKAELTQKCKEYQVATQLKASGVLVSVIPPRVINVTKEEYETIY